VTRHVVLIGPVAVGKSTIGPALAGLLGIPFVDLDDVAADHYAEVGQGIDQLIEQSKAHGFIEAHRWWQPGRVQAVRRVLETPEASVIAFGAGHSHFEDEQWFDEVSTLLADAFVVFLLPEDDVDASVTLLRQRCVDERGQDQDWLLGDVDFIREWVGSDQNRTLADALVYSGGRSIVEIARDIAALVQDRRDGGLSR
jgi:shikimate kinase